MTRKARMKSESGIYHIMLRGINRQVIFEDEEDNNKFIQVLTECKEKSRFELYAYCLMGNHVHLLLKVGKEELEQIFRRIGSRYVYWYNWKYKRTGHLFQDRFKSEVVENDSYLLTVIRYIHQNPLKAGMCSTIDDYPWSSYKEYFKSGGLVDKDFPISIYNQDKQKAIEMFRMYSNEVNEDRSLEIEEEKRRLSDNEAKDIINKICNIKNTTEFQKIDNTLRDKSIARLKDEGLSIRQISRLTGISFGIVRKI